MVNFILDNFRFVIVDDLVNFDSDNDFISDENCYLELRVKKSFLKKVLNGSSNQSSLSLTKREIQVIKYLSKGLNNSQIAEKMGISVHTTKAHIRNIFDKLSVQGRTEAVVKAIKDNLINL